MDRNGLAARLIDLAQDRARLLIAIAGPPGAGKSTLAEALVAGLVELGQRSALVPMDGFHLDDRILERSGLLGRKGAPETFDADGFVNAVQRIAAGDADILVPVFDRAREIAIAGAQRVEARDRFVVFEGNYLLSATDPWCQLLGHWDYSIFLNPGMEELERRLVTRWLDHGHERDAAARRAQDNDIPNARFVLEKSVSADLVLP